VVADKASRVDAADVADDDEKIAVSVKSSVAATGGMLSVTVGDSVSGIGATFVGMNGGRVGYGVISLIFIPFRGLLQPNRLTETTVRINSRVYFLCLI
jgi:hypothetical protein